MEIDYQILKLLRMLTWDVCDSTKYLIISYCDKRWINQDNDI